MDDEREITEKILFDYMDDAVQKKIISENLQRYIELSGKDQREIALDLDVNYTTFNTWVRGKAEPKLSQLKKIASYFRTTVIHLVNDPRDISDEERLLGFYKGMNEEGRRDLLKYAYLLYNSGLYLEWSKKRGEEHIRKVLGADYTIKKLWEDKENGKS